MKRRPIQDPYQAVVEQFNRNGVRYVVVGMSGINYYARNPSETFATLDYDLFVEPTLLNIEKALRALSKLGFELGTTSGILKKGDLREVVREQRTIIATTPTGFMIELLLRVSGYPFSELEKDAATFTVEGTSIKVGKLDKLLRSKKIAGRPKDRHFLERYKGLLEDS